jgi:hypothetical protein
MNYEEIKARDIEQMAQQLRNNEPVKRFQIFPHRFELRDILADDEDALMYLENLVDSVNESI